MTQPDPQERMIREDLRDIRTALERLDAKLDRTAERHDTAQQLLSERMEDRFDRLLTAVERLGERVEAVNRRQDILIDMLATHIAQRHAG